MNLWSDFDNNQQQPAALTSRARRLSEQMVLSTLRAWLLRDYVATYCRSLGAARIFRRCYWVDALGIDARANAEAAAVKEGEQENGSTAPVATRSGRGRKKEAAKRVPPALEPVVALAHALDEASEGKAVSLFGLALEAGSSTRKDAHKARKELVVQDDVAGQNGSNGKVASGITGAVIEVPKEGGVVRASWLVAGASVLQAIDPAPAIFLLNPFGPTLFSYNDLAPLYQRTTPTELCLLVSHKQVEARLRAALRTPAQGAILTALLRSDRWKTFELAEEGKATTSTVGIAGKRIEQTRGISVEEAIDGVLSLFIASMQRHFLVPIQRLALPLVTRPALVEEAPYTLIFATRRQDSLFTMNDAVCLYQREVYEQSPRGVLGEEWFVAQRHARMQQERQQLYERIAQQGRAQRVRRWPDLRQQLLLANFGRYTLLEYDEAIRVLLSNKEVRCEWRRKPVEGEEERVPSVDDALLW